ncbi:DUF2513 domain-containing protein [Phaeovulum vinaykumarii]|uniref:DUF2513 domain-containing protein n=1 Tax=Phaeovulum vinaykumarii TaxID=407234 RepID=A0A1N7MKR3_9RHOB|nr:DUF2513 domain-containing protein [Phaeovulum vinaykumarii]SIS86693.1 Hypothetical protein SAMN05421795_10829 [Phaeovulum vinaykumarii]SOC13457.1 uncharacterized protein DUF2513 [Phaeovulum vinaykumarii]
MKRDDEYIRELLFKYEADEDWLLFMPGLTKDDDAEWNERGHVHLMIDEGLVAPVGKHGMRLTSAGHDYLDAIRNDGIWEKTKEGAAAVGGATLGMMKDIAVAYLKQAAAEKLGITL